MTQDSFPITPPRELMQQWMADSPKVPIAHGEYIATQAARWGADQELEACCEYLTRCAAWEPEDVQEMRDLRRPKPPSLKEQALQALYRFDDTEGHDGLTQEQIAKDFVVIRRALESLPD